MLEAPERAQAKRTDASKAMDAPRIYTLPSARAASDDRMREILRLHFDWVEIPLSSPGQSALGNTDLPPLRAACAAAGRAGLNVMVALDFAATGSDPDRVAAATEVVRSLRSGAQGLRCIGAQKYPAEAWRAILSAGREAASDLIWVADALGASPEESDRLLSAGFDFFLTSVKWWNGIDGWAVEQYERTRGRTRSIGFPEAPGGQSLRAELAQSGDSGWVRAMLRLRYALAAFFGAGVMMPMGYELSGEAAVGDVIDVRAAITAVNRLKATFPATSLEPAHRQLLLGELMGWVRVDESGAPLSAFVGNPTQRGLSVDIASAAAETGVEVGALRDITPGAIPRLVDRPLWLLPGDWRVFLRERVLGDQAPPRVEKKGKAGARPIRKPSPARVVIERVEPEIDGGRSAIKRVAGDRLEVQADIFSDGHEVCGAALLLRPVGDAAWSVAPLRYHDNDRWVGAIALPENRRYVYCIEAWIDDYASWRNGLASKHDTGQDIALELAEGRHLLTAAARRATGEARRVLKAALEVAESPASAAIDALLAEDVQAAMAEWGPRHGVTRYDRELPLIVDRPAARFAAWYEMVPRSQGSVSDRSATFQDCIARLDDISGDGVRHCLPPADPSDRAHQPQGPQQRAISRARRSRQPLCHRRRGRRPRRDPPGPRHARGFPRLRRRLPRARHGGRARFRGAVLARPSLGQGASRVVRVPARRLDPVRREPAEEISGHRQSQVRCDGPHGALGGAQGYRAVLDRGRASPSSASTIRTPSRLRSGSG